MTVSPHSAASSDVPSVDKWLSKRWRKKVYECNDLVRDVWLDETGEDLAQTLPSLMRRDRTVKLAEARRFKKLDTPSSPCLVIMQRHGVDPHVGVFLRGKLLHLQYHGAEYLPVDLAARGFTSVKFYQ